MRLRDTAFPTVKPRRLAAIAESWWVETPARLRRYTLLLSDCWYDGLYLTRWPLAATLAPLLVFLIGFLEGIAHWTFVAAPGFAVFGEPNVAFTQLLPLMTFAAVAGALSANLGLMVVLGYAASDYLITGPQLSLNLYASPPILGSTALATFCALRVPQIVSYVLFLLLAVTPTLSAKSLVARLRRIAPRESPTGTLIRAVVIAAAHGALVYAWTLSAPLLIRIFWSWTNGSPPVSAAYFAQQMAGWIVWPAVCGALVRCYLAFRAYQDAPVVARLRRLNTLFKEVEARSAWPRTLPSAVRAVLAAGLSTLLIGGFLSSMGEGVLTFLFFAVILVARGSILPRLAPWALWMRLAARVPLLLRLLIGGVISYEIARCVLSVAQGQPTFGDSISTDSFQPVVLGACLSLLVMTVLLPQAQPARRPGMVAR